MLCCILQASIPSLQSPVSLTNQLQVLLLQTFLQPQKTIMVTTPRYIQKCLYSKRKMAKTRHVLNVIFARFKLAINQCSTDLKYATTTK
jgi:hypothetical protein